MQMKILTRNFGELEIDASEIIHFKQPLYGFEELRDYVLLYDDDIGGCFIWLQSTEDRDTCFIMVDPGVLPGHYAPVLPSEVVEQLELAQESDAIVRVIAVIPEDFAEATVNLKSPVVINTVKHCASQVMLEDDFPLRAPMMAGERGR